MDFPSGSMSIKNGWPADTDRQTLQSGHFDLAKVKPICIGYICDRM